MPLDEHIEGRHGEGQPCLKIRPAPMHHLLQMTLRHEVARLIVWQPLTRPVVPSTVSYVVRQQGNTLSNAHGQRTHSHPTDACTARERRICQHQVEMGRDGCMVNTCELLINVVRRNKPKMLRGLGQKAL